jgi:hypothetical protein
MHDAILRSKRLLQATEAVGINPAVFRWLLHFLLCFTDHADPDFFGFLISWKAPPVVALSDIGVVQATLR